MTEPDKLAEEFSERVATLPPGAPVCVAFSGGLDSAVLLHLFAEHAESTGRKVCALHVHHGLSPNADAWVRVCERVCANEGVALTVERVRVEGGAPQGVEGAARIARYAAYAARPEPVIALAHHLDDQAQTVLFPLLRGTGIKGIAAMPLRPVPRRSWKRTVSAWSSRWCASAMNGSVRAAYTA